MSRSFAVLLLAFLSLVPFAGAEPLPMSPDHPNAQLIARFYTAFNAHDAKIMGACYAPDVEFSDEVFPELHGSQATGMWRMLCTQGKDLKIVASKIQANDTCGSAHWDAWYTFSTGRKVHNIVEARFTFKNGLVVRHIDSFDFWAWSRQALGPAGTLLGWTSLLKAKVRRTAARGLEKFLAANP